MDDAERFWALGGRQVKSRTSGAVSGFMSPPAQAPRSSLVMALIEPQTLQSKTLIDRVCVFASVLRICRTSS